MVRSSDNSSLQVHSNLHKRDAFWKFKTGCYTQVSVLSRSSQKSCHEEIFYSVRVMIKLQYKGDPAVCLKLFSDFIWDFGKLPFPVHLGKFSKILGKKSPKYTKLGKYRPFFDWEWCLYKASKMAK